MKGYVLTCVYQAHSSLENCVHPWQNMMRRLIRDKVAEKEHSLLHSAMLQFIFSVVIHSVLWLFLPSSLSSSLHLSLSVFSMSLPSSPYLQLYLTISVCESRLAWTKFASFLHSKRVFSPKWKFCHHLLAIMSRMRNYLPPSKIFFDQSLSVNGHNHIPIWE